MTMGGDRPEDKATRQSERERSTESGIGDSENQQYTTERSRSKTDLESDGGNNEENIDHNHRSRNQSRAKRVKNLLRHARWRRWFGRHLLLALASFGIGGIGGAILGVVVPVDTGGSLPAEQLLPASFTVGAIAANNLVVMVVTALGVVTFGLTTLLVLVVNGFLAGFIMTLAIKAVGPLVALALIIPHGILELPAFFLLSAVVFRINHRAINLILERSDTPVDTLEAFEGVVLVLMAVVLILVAAWVEVAVTPNVGRAVAG